MYVNRALVREVGFEVQVGSHVVSQSQVAGHLGQSLKPTQLGIISGAVNGPNMVHSLYRPNSVILVFPIEISLGASGPKLTRIGRNGGLR